MEVWGGHECTVNRVGDRFTDQTVLSGHHARQSDLELFADLGLAALRYPILWERIAPNDPEAYDWRWTDARLRKIEQLGMRVVGGLVHHGSGPRYTHLLDDGFAPGLAKYARAAAERYPHIRDWTPVNEPLTTARFSALYGHWYPHHADEHSFWTALLNQIDAIRMAMRQIRTVNPHARLIQTEDFGRTYSTAPANHQATHDNERRWMTWDLLCGRVTPQHYFWDRLARMGFSDRLAAIADDPCPPDVLGVNHYVTSDRFLDHRWQNYPATSVGGNDSVRFADVAAVRAAAKAPAGLEGALTEAWARYAIRLAVTESHLSCTREEQLRWLIEGWQIAARLAAGGLDIEAVTVWSLLGAFDWNSLVTRADGCYESGVFDVRGEKPRATILAAAVRSLTTPGPPLPYAVHGGTGWWRRDIRLGHAADDAVNVSPSQDESSQDQNLQSRSKPAVSPILITGATGTLGQAIAGACRRRALDYVLTDRSALSLDAQTSIEAAIARHRPWAVINAAGWVRVDDAELEQNACFEANTDGCVRLAAICQAFDIPCVSFSSDLVFDGGKTAPYVEDDLPNPLNVYGHSKAKAEAKLNDLGGKTLTIRTSAFFSPFDSHNFAVAVARRLAAGERMEAASDLTVSPTYVPDLVNAVLDLLMDGETGLWNLSSNHAVTWADFALIVAESLGLHRRQIDPRPWRDLGFRAERPRAAALTSSRGILLPKFDDAIGRFAQTMRADGWAAKPGRLVCV